MSNVSTIRVNLPTATVPLLFFFALSASNTVHANALTQIVLTDYGPDIVFHGISPNGNFATGQNTSSGEAFRLDGGTTFVSLGTLGGATSIGEKVNNNGQVTGYSETNVLFGSGAFRYDGTLQNLSLGFSAGRGEDIDSSNRIVGWVDNGAARTPMLWDASNNSTPLLGGGFDARAWGLSAAGFVGILGSFTGYYTSDANGLTPDSTFPGFNAQGGINDSGRVAGLFSSGGAGYWDVGDANPTSIPGLEDPNKVTNVTAAGDILIQARRTVYHFAADGTVTDLNSLSFAGDPFDSLNVVGGISDTGLVVGTGFVDGASHGFIGQLVPEPSTPVLLFLSLPMMFFRCRRGV